MYLFWKQGCAATSIAEFSDIVAAETEGDQDNMGCFMVNTAGLFAACAGCSGHGVHSLLRIRGFFIACLRRAKSLKLVAASIDEDAEAAALLQKLIGIRVLARSGGLQ